MKKTKIYGVTILVVIAALFLNTNSVDDSKSNFNLASLATMNNANAEQTLTCYGTYELGGKAVINKCYGCTQVGHVLNYEVGTKSTCTIP